MKAKAYYQKNRTARLAYASNHKPVDQTEYGKKWRSKNPDYNKNYSKQHPRPTMHRAIECPETIKTRLLLSQFKRSILKRIPGPTRDKYIASKRQWAKSDNGKKSTDEWLAKNPGYMTNFLRKKMTRLGKVFDMSVDTYAYARMSWAKDHKAIGECSYCGSTGDLHAHHILPVSKFPGMSLVDNNGTSLCIPCHKEHHRLNGIN